MGKQFVEDDAEMSTPPKGAPLKMSVEIGKLADLTNMLLRTVNASSQPSGRRSGSGADVGVVVRQIVKQNQRVKDAEGKMKEHQELQGIVRAKANEVVKAEKALARCVKDFGDIEARLSHVLHDVAARHSVSGESDCTQTGGSAQRKCSVVDVEDIIAYSNHCSFSTSAGIRWFDPQGRPLHPPNVLDPRFLQPYPAAHSMRQQGGMFSHASTRRPAKEQDSKPETPVRKRQRGTGDRAADVSGQGVDGVAAGLHEGVGVDVLGWVSEESEKRVTPEGAKRVKPNGGQADDELPGGIPQGMFCRDSDDEDAGGALFAKIGGETSEEDDDFEMDLNPAAAEVPPQSQTSAENNLVKQEEGSSLKNDEDVGMPDQTGSAGGSDVAVKKEDGEAGEREESGARRASGEGGQDGESSEDDEFDDAWEMELNPGQ